MYIENMQDSFEKLDGVLNEINGMAEAEEVDPYQVKAIFYALFLVRSTLGWMRGTIGHSQIVL